MDVFVRFGHDDLISVCDAYTYAFLSIGILVYKERKNMFLDDVITEKLIELYRLCRHSSGELFFRYSSQNRVRIKKVSTMHCGLKLYEIDAFNSETKTAFP